MLTESDASRQFDLCTDRDHDRREDRSLEQISWLAVLLWHVLDEQHERRDEQEQYLQLAKLREAVGAILDALAGGSPIKGSATPSEKERFEEDYYEFPGGLCFAYDAIVKWDDTGAVPARDRGNLRAFAQDYAGVRVARALKFTSADVRTINERLKQRYIAMNPAECEAGWFPKGKGPYWGSPECVGPKHHASEEIDATSDWYETTYATSCPSALSSGRAASVSYAPTPRASRYV